MVELPAFCCIEKHGYITNKNICENKCDNLSCVLKTPASPSNYIARKRLQQTVNRRYELLGNNP